MSIAVICNSTNPDLYAYFEAKHGISAAQVGETLLWYGNARLPQGAVKVRYSSFSPTSGFGIYFFIDLLWSFYVIASLLVSRARFVVFDTAHISNVAIALWCKVFQIQTIFTIHDWQAHPGRRNVVISLYNRVCKEFLADRFIVFSTVDYHAKPVEILRLSGFKPSPIAKGEGRYFLFFGRIEPYKGLANLVAIAKVLLEQEPGVEVWVAGKGADPNLALLLELPNVRLLNRFIGDEELAPLFGGAIATILPYDSATQSGVCVLSYAYHTPVVAFDVGALSQYVDPGESGELVPHGDIAGFVERMLYVKRHAGRYSGHIQERFGELYSVEALQMQYVALLSSLVRGHRSIEKVIPVSEVALHSNKTD